MPLIARRPIVLCALLSAAPACRDQALEARLAAVELELASRETAAPAAPQPIKTPPLVGNECIGDLEPVQATLAFLAQLDGLMAGYVPKEPEGGDPVATGLECSTEARTALDPELRRQARRLQAAGAGKKPEAARLVADKEGVRRGFLEAFTWADDLSRYRATRYGCHVKDGGGAWTWAVGVAGLDACEGLGAEAVWRVRRAVEVYPDGGLPELMRRMRGAGLVVPARVACWVDDVGRSGLVGCRGNDGLAFVIDLGPEGVAEGALALDVNRGDVVAVARYRELRRASPEELWAVGLVPADGLQILQRSKCCGG